MSYRSVVEMAQSQSLRERITAAVAAEGISNPEAWTASNMWAIVSAPGWGDQWAYASDTYQVNANPDYGARTDVISDQDILSAVQAAQGA